MIKKGYYSHTAPNGEKFSDRYNKFNYTCPRYGAENLAKTQYGVPVRLKNKKVNTNSEEKVAEAFITMWMNSPGHKRNMLANNWKYEGLGVELSSNDWVFITQNFC